MAFTPDPAARAAFLTDEAGNVISWNNGCEAMFSLSPGQVMGQSICTLLAGHDRARCDGHWADLLAQAGSSAVELRLNGPAGQDFAATLALSPQYGQDGAFRGCVADVTVEPPAGDDGEANRVGRTPLSAIVDMFPGTFYALNRQRHFVLWNRNMENVAEMAPAELAAADALDMFELAQRPMVAENIRRVFDEGAEVQVEADYVTKSGRQFPLLLCGARITCGGEDYLVGMGMDIRERRMQEQRLVLRDRALHAASNGIVISRCAGKDNPIEYVNPAFERITGYSADEAIGRDPRFMGAPGLDDNERAQMRNAIAERRPVNVVLRNRCKNGDVFWNDLHITPVLDEKGVVTHFIGVVNDVTAARQRTAHLEHEVNHDPLTGLANRNLLWDRLEQAVHLAQRHKSLVATVLIDLNNFKTINDTFGHEAGDVVLKVVAKRLLASVRDSDTVARMSGDEFVLVLVNQPSLRYTLRMIERVRQGLTMPVSFNRREIPVGASLGVSVFPHDGGGVAELVRAADVAMYHAKATGKNAVHFFSADMKSTTEAKQRLESGMREALDRDELYLLYQPRICTRTGVVKGFEALLRWRHPEQGVMLPAAFLADAEENGCIVQIGARVMDQACAFLHELRELGYSELPVSVNVSHREYSHHDFVPGIAERLARFGLPAACLQIELREDSLIRNPGLGREVATQLHELGLQLSIDAFGQGISDLCYLQELRPRQVKLAKSAVHAIADGGSGSTIAKTLIDIGHNLNMAVVGEAVETRAQMEFLRSHGCDEIQGIWFSEPLRAEQAEKMLKQHHYA